MIGSLALQSQVAAFAGGSEDYPPGWEDFDPSGLAEPADLSVCPDDQYPPGQHPDVDGIVYKTVTRDDFDAPDIHIKLNQYDARNTSGPRPAAVIVHGGGWTEGCRRHVNGMAWDLSGRGYVVFAVDHRLSCESSDDLEINKMCGWHHPEPVEDVKDAIKWVRQHVLDYYPQWNGMVAAIGNSSGGQLVYQVAGVTAPGDLKHPDVVAGLSGPTEMGYLNNDVDIACEESSAPEGNCLARDTYMDSVLVNQPPSGVQCTDNYTTASPYCRYGGAPAADPPAFIVNAIAEKTGISEATQFDQRLSVLLIVHSLCKVGNRDPSGATDHGSGLTDNGCDWPVGGNVWIKLVTFLDDHTL